jgi:hypothetical protein
MNAHAVIARTNCVGELDSDDLVRKAITYSALYNNNWMMLRHKYVLTSNALYSHFHLDINSDSLKKFNKAITGMVKANKNVVVTPQKEDELRVIHHFLNISDCCPLKSCNISFVAFCTLL